MAGMMGKGRKYSASERRILEAIDAREIADFSSLPDDERSVTADFLHRLISGSLGDRGPLLSPLRIRGASVTGPLLPPSASESESRVAVQFWDCGTRPDRRRDST